MRSRVRISGKQLTESKGSYVSWKRWEKMWNILVSRWMLKQSYRHGCYRRCTKCERRMKSGQSQNEKGCRDDCQAQRIDKLHLWRCSNKVGSEKRIRFRKETGLPNVCKEDKGYTEQEMHILLQGSLE